MKHYGLIGRSLSHSFSKDYFETKFRNEKIEASYHLIELNDLNLLSDAIHNYSLIGFNVTIPYKEKILAFIDDIEPEAKAVGAVNCVKVRDGKLIGYNTDIIGFEISLRNFLEKNSLDIPGVKALVFGTGGASKAAIYVLDKLGIVHVSVSRNEIENGITYADITEEILNDNKLLINTTPVGMYPDVEDKIHIPYKYINHDHLAFDLIYNPPKTTFLRFCEAEGAAIQNGWDMLCIQAEESYKIYQ